MLRKIVKTLSNDQTDIAPDQKYVFKKPPTIITWSFLFEQFNVINSTLYKEIVLTILNDGDVRNQDFSYMFKRMHYIDIHVDHLRNVTDPHFEPLLCGILTLYRQSETVILNIEKSRNKTFVLGIIKCLDIYSPLPIYIMCYIEKYFDKTVNFVFHALRQTDIEYTDIIVFKSQLPDTMFVDNIFNKLNIAYTKNNYQCSTYFYRRL